MLPALLFFLEMEQLFTTPALENTWKKKGHVCRQHFQAKGLRF